VIRINTNNADFTTKYIIEAKFKIKGVVEKSDIVGRFGLESKQYLVTTIHRPSNTDDRVNLKNILDALSESGERVIFPVHPRTKRAIIECGINMRGETIKPIEPLGYIEFLKLMSHARKIVTDSGGIQKEAYILKVPCITLRERTEWIETVEDNWNILVGADKEKITEAIRVFEPASEQRDIFGNGRAATSICQIISQQAWGKEKA